MNMVGAMHAGHHRRNPLNVDVIHFSLLIGYVQNVITEAIILSTRIADHNKVPLVKAWGKLLWIQMDLFTKWHVKDGDQYDMLSTRATKLDINTDLSGMKDENGKEVKCPFSSMAKVENVKVNGALSPGYVYQNADSMNRENIPGGGIGSIQSITQPLSPVSPTEGSGRLPEQKPSSRSTPSVSRRK